MDTQELLKRVRKIEIKTRGLSNHIFSGEYHSAFKGRGMSFTEVREYHYGDDIRNIDWNVTARFNHPFVKVFEEERELTVMLLIDVSQSDFFGTRGMYKSELMTEISAILSFSAITNNDKVGVIFFSGKIEKFIPPKKGTSHILRIIRELLDFQPEHPGTNIAEALRFFNNVMKKLTISFLLSDFIDQDYLKPLSIAARKHDLVGIHFHDPREETIPDIGLVHFKDAETGKSQWIDTSIASNREAYEDHYRKNLQYMKNSFAKSGVDHLTIQTGQPYINALSRFFKKREQRK